MTKDNFFRKYGGNLVREFKDDPEGGDFLFFHPEDISRLQKYINKEGYQVVSVHDNTDEEIVDMTSPCDIGEQPFKYGYYVIKF